MNKWIHFNGALLPAQEKLVGATNRGLRYGDGLFETIKVVNGHMPLLDRHVKRLLHGMGVLQISAPAFLTADYLQQQIQLLCEKNGLTDLVRVRLSVFRGNGTLYKLEDADPCIIIEADPVAPGYDRFNEQGLCAGIYDQVRKSCDILSNIKSNNYLPYVMAAQHARQQGWDEALVLNSHGRICEATIANVFCVKGQVVTTPALGEGCVRGVMRSWVVGELEDTAYVIGTGQDKMLLRVRQEPLTIETLLDADEVFLTNALYGIRWVAQIQNKQYGNTISALLYNHLIPKK